MRLRWLFALIFCVYQVTAHNILVYNPKFGVSHINFMGTLADTLVQAGHNVTTLLSEIDSSHPDGTKISKIIRVPQTEGADEMVTALMSEDLDMFEMNAADFMGLIKNSYHNGQSFTKQCRTILQDRQLIEFLTEQNFDIFITESFDTCGIGLSKVIAARSLITVSTTFMLDSMARDIGLPLFPSFSPSAIAESFDPHSLWDRAENLWMSITTRVFFGIQNNMMQNLYNEFHPGMQSISEIQSHSTVVFTNSDPLLEEAYFTLNKVLQIGGIAVRRPKPLDQHFQKILGLRPSTVIVSFGSIAKSVYMKHQRKRAILEAFSRFPNITFLWKYEDPSDVFSLNEVAKVKNVLLYKWMPQIDLLYDPRVLLFITHGGMASCLEAASAGIPVVAVPIFGDQSRNSGSLSSLGNGVVFNKFDLIHSDKLEKAISTVLYDNKYRMQAKKTAEMIAERPFTAKELFLKHVDFAGKFGEVDNYRLRSVDLSTMEMYNLDLYTIVIISALFSLYIVRKALHFVVRTFNSSPLRISIAPEKKLQ